MPHDMPVAMTIDSGIILHHYDASPFSEKVRLLCGLKGLSWQSVVTPNMLPKPDLVPLTGGYRRAPVMQIGADVYCDSQVIMAEIERRWPGAAHGPGQAGPAWAVNLWADRLFFQASVIVIFGRIGDRIDPAFAADRAKLSGRPFDATAMAAMAPAMAGQWRAQAAWIERALAAGGAPFLGGAAASIADIAAYMNPWFVDSAFPDLAARLTEGMPALAAWRERIAAIGHGVRQELSGADALAVARAAAPGDAPPHDAGETLVPGDAVVVAADDYGRDPIAGSLVALSPERITIARDTDDLGRLHLHFPRMGFIVTGA